MDEPEDRAERAVRAALAAPAQRPPEIDLAGVHRRVRRRRIGLAAATVTAVLLAAAVAVPQLVQPREPVIAGPSPVASPVATSTIPPGWRVELYRTISFTVPDSWGYADAPTSDWCVTWPDGRPRGSIAEPYVSLGGSTIVRSIQCPPMPASLAHEHVEVYPYPSAAEVVPGTSMQRDWWTVVDVVGDGADAVVITVVSKDKALATDIASSAKTSDSTDCGPKSPADWWSRRPAPVDLAAAQPVEEVVICQYDVAEDAAFGGLRARALVRGEQADQLIAALTSGQEGQPVTCTPGALPELALTVKVTAPQPTTEAYVIASGCPTVPGGTAGGIDDGRALRTLGRDDCRQLMVPPVRLESASAGLARTCIS